MSTTKIIELGKKIYELTQRGIQGEKEAAILMLEKFMLKHGISLDDIEGDKREMKTFRFKNRIEERLIAQIAVNVVGKGVQKFSNRYDKKVLCLELTESQYVEFSLKLSVWRKLLYEEMEVFYEAFVAKNDIYAIDGEVKELHQMSREDRKRALRVQNMAENIKMAEIHKQLKTAN